MYGYRLLRIHNSLQKTFQHLLQFYRVTQCLNANSVYKRDPCIAIKVITRSVVRTTHIVMRPIDLKDPRTPLISDNKIRFSRMPRNSSTRKRKDGNCVTSREEFFLQTLQLTIHLQFARVCKVEAIFEPARCLLSNYTSLISPPLPSKNFDELLPPAIVNVWKRLTKLNPREVKFFSPHYFSEDIRDGVIVLRKLRRMLRLILDPQLSGLFVVIVKVLNLSSGNLQHCLSSLLKTSTKQDLRGQS